MKKWYVYELVNLMGTIEYVGETMNPKRRFCDHKCLSGKFANRNDIFMNVVCEFNNRRDAWDYQCELQSEYGFESEHEMRIKYSKLGSSKGGDVVKRPISCYINSTKEFISDFNSLTDAANELKISVGNIGNVLSGRYKQTNGYYFKYKKQKTL